MIEQPTLFDVPPETAQAKTAQAGARKMQAAPPANATICKSLSEALQCKAGGLCLICPDPDWPTFDLNDRSYFTPDSEKYIEAERLPPEWIPLLGKTVCADRTTVGTIADLLEELPPDVANEWRELYAACESDEGERALSAFEEAHNIRWYGEGYYIE